MIWIKRIKQLIRAFRNNWGTTIHVGEKYIVIDNSGKCIIPQSIIESGKTIRIGKVMSVTVNAITYAFSEPTNVNIHDSSLQFLGKVRSYKTFSPYRLKSAIYTSKSYNRICTFGEITHVFVDGKLYLYSKNPAAVTLNRGTIKLLTKSSKQTVYEAYNQTLAYLFDHIEKAKDMSPRNYADFKNRKFSDFITTRFLYTDLEEIVPMLEAVYSNPTKIDIALNEITDEELEELRRAIIHARINETALYKRLELLAKKKA